MESHILHVFTIVMLYMLNSTGVKYLLTNGISLWFESTEKLTLRNTVVMDTSMYTPNSSVNLIWNQYSFGWLFWNNRLSYFSELKETGTPCERMWIGIVATVGDPPPYSLLVIWLFTHLRDFLPSFLADENISLITASPKLLLFGKSFTPTASL